MIKFFVTKVLLISNKCIQLAFGFKTKITMFYIKSITQTIILKIGKMTILKSMLCFL